MQEGLVPIGNSGFWHTPTEPVDPRDCDRWPDSPYCTSVGIDPLNAGIQSGIDLVTQGEIGYDTFDPLSGLGIEEYSAINDLASRGRTFNPWNLANLEPSVTINNCEQCITVSPTLFYISLPPYTICHRFNDGSCRANLEPEPEPPEDLQPPDMWFPNQSGIGHSNCWYTVTVAMYQARIRYNEGLERIVTFPPIYKTSTLKGPYLGFLVRIVNHQYRGYVCWGASDRYPNGARSWLTEHGVYGAESYRGSGPIPSPLPHFVSIERFTGQLFGIPQQEILTCDERPYIQPPPQPQREPMACCNTAEIEELLRLVALRLGVNQYPASVPQNLLTNLPERQIQLQSLTELFGWYVRQFDALIGEFPIDIKIQDVDPLTEGNQEQEIKLMNVAETLTELYALAAKSSINGDLHTNFLTRLAAEVIATKNASIVTQDYARANAQFLGYKGNPKKRKIPYAFDTEQLDSLEKLLKNSDKFVVGWQEDDPESVVNYLQKIVFAAGIIKAVFFRGGSQASQLVNELRNLIDPTSDPQQSRNENWEAFLTAINDPSGRFNADSPTRPHITDPEIEL
ncbi:MAG: hypothetical protein HC833_21850 [Leptolyngbyaceae cyanobacterium RM1_406_9]|nr:hypothetical protein [Leptolyngbyaceae cyanobacterium RM1_406_9]